MTAGLVASLLMPATMMLDPIRYDSGRLWMLLPLTLAIAVVYKATRVEHIRQLPVPAVLLWLTIVVSMIGVYTALQVVAWVFI